MNTCYLLTLWSNVIVECCHFSVHVRPPTSVDNQKVGHTHNRQPSLLSSSSSSSFWVSKIGFDVKENCGTWNSQTFKLLSISLRGISRSHLTESPKITLNVLPWYIRYICLPALQLETITISMMIMNSNVVTMLLWPTMAVRAPCGVINQNADDNNYSPIKYKQGM